jgi:hypothetical protein
MLKSTDFVLMYFGLIRYKLSCDWSITKPKSKATILASLARQEMEHDVNHYHQHQAMEMELPPGFRFHPTDEEPITHYLARKAADPRFAARAVGEADLNKCEPWDLPCT